MPGGANIIHYNAVRIRGTGVGNLDLEFQGYDDILTEDLVPLAMTTTASREMNRLSNFQSQAGKLRLSTNVIDEVMNITAITIFVKALWSDYPG